MEAEKSVSKQEKLTLERGFKIMELVTQIVASAAREGKGQQSLNIEEMDELVQTLFSTMCELLLPLPPKEKGRVRVF